IAEDIALPTEYMLDQNYPNPFNPSTTIRYGLPEDSNVSLVIYDVRGQVVQTLESGHQSAGWYDIVWNGETAEGKTISTGIYFARLVAGEYSQVIKMLYLK
ncbi:MAG: T9SS type A sorting domain-containing protein, partial [Candidatus Marinimicrobia bacterium]|nr:T9SS type A sorting domain-containing protein [Candidatus Neomarinimicrobiota bacterium]